MRLSKQQAEAATTELLQMLAKHGELPTSIMSGTPKFHGVRTLQKRLLGFQRHTKSAGLASRQEKHNRKRGVFQEGLSPIVTRSVSIFERR
jgi:hypothetical protein